MVHVRSASSPAPLAAQPSRTLAELGICQELLDACEAMGWRAPTKIQSEAIPYALEGRDLVGLGQTGSGKTGAFALPIIQALLDDRRPFFALVLSPTRELAIQIAEQFEALGSAIGLVCAVVATPGRLLDHLTDTKGFSLKNLKYLVLDEADQLLDVQFEKTYDDIINVIPKERRTYLFSATMTAKHKRLGALNRFKTKDCDILVCTDVASRGLDIHGVNVVINYDIPTNSKDYVHRVGRTARAGLSGYAVSLVNQCEVVYFKLIEQKLFGGEREIDKCEVDADEIKILHVGVTDAKRMALTEMKESSAYKKRKKAGDDYEEAENRTRDYRKSKPLKRQRRR
ncbi:hypothetical protein ACQ4PT_029541 [Festuca glaucescens]